MALILPQAMRRIKLHQMYERVSLSLQTDLVSDRYLRRRSSLLINEVVSNVSSFYRQASIAMYSNSCQLVPGPPTATIQSVKKISSKTYHIVFHHNELFNQYKEGQYFGVYPPAKKASEPDNAKKLRYFFVACSRHGEKSDKTTASICVRRPGLLKRVCKTSISELLCTSKPGEKFHITGPTGEAITLKDSSPNSSHIFVATKTGIAPFRSHLGHLFSKDAEPKFSGQVWLFHIVSNMDNELYKEEFNQYKRGYPGIFHYVVTEKKNGPIYKFTNQNYFGIHDTDVFDMLTDNNKSAYIYLAGSKKMVTPIEKTLEKVAMNQGQDWKKTIETWKDQKKWRVKVY